MSMSDDGEDDPLNGPLPEHMYKNIMGQYTALTEEVFLKEWGLHWKTLRMAKTKIKWDFSDSAMYALETLEGPQQGVMMPKLLGREFVEIINVSKNQLTDIACLNYKDAQGRQEFRRLQVLVASRNQLTECHLQLPSMLELNLSKNQLRLLPDCSSMPQLTTLILSHNRIDGLLKDGIGENKRLKKLDISNNQFSWKPTVFKEQLDMLASGKQYYVTSLRLWPNPFAEHFKEYQFLCVAGLDSLVELDGFTVDRELRSELRGRKEQMPNVDYSLFDVWVEQRKPGMVIKDGQEDHVDAGRVPTLEDLTNVLQKPLDFQSQLVERIKEFDTLVSYVWGASIRDRENLVKFGGRETKEELLQNQVNEFVDKMTMVLQRFDSAQEVLVRCLVRLCASGYAPLSQRCATLLAEWIEGLPPETKAKLTIVAGPLFKELRLKMIRGLQSFSESPKVCYLSQFSPDESQSTTALSGNTDDIDECAGILDALSTFALPVYARKPQVLRARVLKPFLPALCRATREELGPDKLNTDGWETYYDYESCLDEMNPEDILEVQRESFNILMEKCLAKSYGGFVSENIVERPGFIRAYFSPHHPEVLVGLRKRSAGKVLHIRPVPKSLLDGLANHRPAPHAKVRSWDSWYCGLSVLTLATDDPDNAATCINKYKTHEVVISHIQTHFTDTWVLVSEQAMNALVQLLLLCVNLMRAGGEAGNQAKAYFATKLLHEDVFKRIRRRLTENGTALELKVLKAQSPTFCALISSLVEVCSEMSVSKIARMSGLPAKPDASIMQPLVTPIHVEAFYILLDIVADTETPDPLLLAAALEAIWMFIEATETRKEVITRVLQKLHDSAVLLPFILGPHLKDGSENAKYRELWLKCEVKYSVDSNRIGVEVDEDIKETLRNRVPDLKDLQHPLMHRVLLAIVALIEQFSRKAADDPTGGLLKATDVLDKADREQLLIGPSGGLVLVPDWDVKIECVKSIKHVLYMNAAQFEQQEMGWLLRYLNSTGIGMGNQEVFLTHVLDLIIVLVTDETKTGHRFRQHFAKAAIRESFDMLRVNSQRDAEASAEGEGNKLRLSRVIVKFLNICSRPCSGNLRPFLRRVDLLEKLQQTIISEDRHEKKSIRGRLLATWTGRDMREVLLPLATGNDLNLMRMGRYRALCRTADVLQGLPDYTYEEEQAQSEESSKFRMVDGTDEVRMWPGLHRIRSLALQHDELERTDFSRQQLAFAFLDGYRQLFEFGERFFTQLDQVRWPTAGKLVREWTLDAEKAAKAWTAPKPEALKNEMEDQGQSSRGKLANHRVHETEQDADEKDKTDKEESHESVHESDEQKDLGGLMGLNWLNLRGNKAKSQAPPSQEVFLRAYMGSSIRRAAPVEHGEFRRTPPDFRAVAEKVLGTAAAVSYKQVVKRDSIMDQGGVAALLLSPVYRCFYVAMEVSVVPELKCMAINEIIGQVEDPGELPRFIQLSVAALLSEEGEVDDSCLVQASLTAKTLRTISAALAWAPENSEPAAMSPHAGTDFEDDGYKKKKKVVKGTHKDAHRLQTLHLLSSYLKFLSRPLHRRLSVVGQRDLTHEELLLLKEYVTCVEKMARVLFGNEMRTDAKPEHHHATNLLTAIADVELVTHDSSKSAISPAQRRLFTVFNTLVGGLICRVLVQTALYAMHLEAKMFERSHTLGDHDAKTISSLTQRAVTTLAIAMYGGGETATDYNVCEALSQAMTSHVQVVPRPRVMQLLREWRTEVMRTAVQAKIDKLDAVEVAKDPGAEPLGKVMQLALVYVFTEQGGTAGALRLLAITSRLRLLTFDASSASSSSGQMSEVQSDHLALIHTPPPHLKDLRRVLVHPRLRQFLAIAWNPDKMKDRREVWVFENSMRRMAFREILRLVKPDIKKEVSHHKQSSPKGQGATQDTKAVRKDEDTALFPLLEGPPPLQLEHTLVAAGLVAAGAAKPGTDILVGLAFIQTTSPFETMDVLLVTRELIFTLNMSDFLQQLWTVWDLKVDDFACASKPILLDDSDSDDETLPEPMEEPKGSIVPSFSVREGPFKIASLSGVRFMAGAVPTVELNTESGPVTFKFFSDGERKRFRQQLNAVLSSASGWSVYASSGMPNTKKAAHGE